MKKIEKDIYYEDSYHGVTLGALVFPNGIILIDAPLRNEDARSWRSALADLGGGPNRLLVNLDSHPDRTLGARAMECTILSHQRTAQVFRTRPSIFKGQDGESGSDWESYNDAVGTRWSAPDITFTQRVNLHWSLNEVIIEHHPGPNAGSIWVNKPASRVVFVGDVVVENQPPFMAYADIPSWIESLELLLASFRDYTIVSGRGGPVALEHVKLQHKQLKDIVRGLERLAKRNASLDATENLIPNLLAAYSYPPALEEQYVQRLRHGLRQYYARRYRPVELSNQARENE